MSVIKTMVCEEAADFLSRYQDNELDPVTRAKLDAHLQGCETCQKELQQLKEIAIQVKQLPAVEAGPYFTDRVMGKVMEKEQEKKSRWTWLPLPSLAKVIYSIVFIIFLVLGVWLNMDTASMSPVLPAAGDTGLGQKQELQMVRLLVESQDLSLINVQEQTIAMLYNGNGEAHAK